MHLRVPVERRATQYARGLSVWAHMSILKQMKDTAMAAVDIAALDAAKSKLLADLERSTPGSAKVRGMARIARIRQIGGIAPYGDSVRTTPIGSFEDMRQHGALESRKALTAHGDANAGNLDQLLSPSAVLFDEEEVGPKKAVSTRRARKRNYERRSDPACSVDGSRRPAASGRGRKATPKTATSVAADADIDFYSDTVKA
jgi:hypothetical protein